MPTTIYHNRNLHRQVYLMVAVLYVMEYFGFDKTSVEAGLVICYFLLYRY